MDQKYKIEAATGLWYFVLFVRLCVWVFYMSALWRIVCGSVEDFLYRSTRPPPSGSQNPFLWLAAGKAPTDLGVVK